MFITYNFFTVVCAFLRDCFCVNMALAAEGACGGLQQDCPEAYSGKGTAGVCPTWVSECIDFILTELYKAVVILVAVSRHCPSLQEFRAMHGSKTIKTQQMWCIQVLPIPFTHWLDTITNSKHVFDTLHIRNGIIRFQLQWGNQHHALNDQSLARQCLQSLLDSTRMDWMSCRRVMGWSFKRRHKLPRPKYLDLAALHRSVSYCR